MTEDVFEILRQLELYNSNEKKFYVYYDPSTGEIIHFRNYFEDDPHPFIEVLESELDTPIEQFDLKKYFVSKKGDKAELSRIDTIAALENINNIDSLIYQLPKVDLKDFNNQEETDLIVEQDNIKEIFRIIFSKATKERFLRYRSMQQELNIYVTAESDPNILYKTLKFKISDLIDNDSFVINFEDFSGENCNLFSVKYFESYIHVDIR